MRVYIRAAVVALAVVLAVASTALAAKTFTIAPFEVNGSAAYKYLEKSIPDMFASRLFWQGQFEPAKKTGASKAIASADETAAMNALAAAGADYVIWGSVTIVGENCSIDVRVRDKAGTNWPISRESEVKRLIPDLRQVSDAINANVFQRTQAKAATRAPQQQPERVNRMNPDIVRNETSNAEVYINPQFRYSGQNADDSRLRSQTLPFASVGMEVCDADGDGSPEVFLLEKRRLYAFRYDGESNLKQLAVLEFPARQESLSLRSIDLGSGRPSLIVNVKEGDEAREEISTRIINFDGQNFKEIARARDIYLSVVNMPPMYQPTLIGQRSDPLHLFRPGIHEASVRGNSITLGAKIGLPKEFKVFNFAYVPAGMDVQDAAKMVMLNDNEQVVIYSEKGARMAATEEKYSGAVQGIYVDNAMPGMGADTVAQGTTYYIPMRFLITDLDSDGNYEILINKPISTAALVFGNYRSFPQSEIQSLQWDGLGLALVWKTRRIKGSVVDYTIADPNGDGILDLVVCVNTHPGALGAAARKTMVMLYPLDLSKADPATAPSFTE